MIKAAWAGVALGVLASAALAQSQLADAGWVTGYPPGISLERSEGLLSVEIVRPTEVASVAVRVNGCGGERDFRSFGRNVDGGENQARDVAAALRQLLVEARRVCGFEERLAARIEQGAEPAFANWVEQETSMDMNMMDANVSMNAVECAGPDCNGM